MTCSGACSFKCKCATRPHAPFAEASVTYANVPSSIPLVSVIRGKSLVMAENTIVETWPQMRLLQQNCNHTYLILTQLRSLIKVQQDVFHWLINLLLSRLFIWIQLVPIKEYGGTLLIDFFLYNKTTWRTWVVIPAFQIHSECVRPTPDHQITIIEVPSCSPGCSCCAHRSSNDRSTNMLSKIITNPLYYLTNKHNLFVFFIISNIYNNSIIIVLIMYNYLGKRQVKG